MAFNYSGRPGARFLVHKARINLSTGRLELSYFQPKSGPSFQQRARFARFPKLGGTVVGRGREAPLFKALGTDISPMEIQIR